MTDALRTAELAAIHIAKKQLGLDDDAYRATVERISKGRCSSAGDLDETERRALIGHFRSAGFERKGGSPRAADNRPQAAKLRALWHSLFDLGATRTRDDDALAAFVCRHTGKEAMRWNRGEDLRDAIECLKGWCERIGYQAAASKMEGPCQGRFEPELIRAQWRRLHALGAFEHGIHARLDTWLRNQGWGVADPGFLLVREAKAAVNRLGVWLRKLAAEKAQADGAGNG